MATTYPITLAQSSIRRVRFIPVTAVAQFASPFTGSRQVFAHPKQHWRVEVEMVPMSREDGDLVLSRLLSLNGAFGTFYLGDPLYTSPRGVATGTPLIKGAGQTGNTIETDGWTVSTNNIVRRGDWLQIGSGSTQQLVKVTADADSDVSGNATLEIWPRVRTAFADNTAIITTNTKGVFALDSADGAGWEIDPDQLIKGVAFTATEAF